MANCYAALPGNEHMRVACLFCLQIFIKSLNGNKKNLETKSYDLINMFKQLKQTKKTEKKKN